MQPSSTETRPAPSAPRRRTAKIAFAAGVAVTLLVAGLLWHIAAQRDRVAFEAAARDAQAAVLQRVETSVALLRGAAGLFSAFDREVDTAGFHRYVERLALETQYPGILGIGFSRRMTAAEEPRIEQAMRAQGFPQFRVWPEHERAERHSIVNLEPLDERNRAAIGYDMYTNPVRAQAMAKARDSGAAAASAMVQLVQEIDARKQPGFLIYLPVYRGGTMPRSVEERRERLLGFAYSPIRSGDFLASAFRTPPGVAVSVYHGAAPDPASVLYDDTSDHSPRFTRTETVDVVGQPWTFAFRSRQTHFEAIVQPLLVVLGGTLLSWLLAALVLRQADARWDTQRALERERAARSEAERANVMKDEFLATVSHELRTPLGSIVGWAELLRSGKLPASEIPTAAEVLHRNAQAQSKLIEDLLDMNRIITGKMRLELHSVDMARAVEEAIASARPAAEAKNIVLESDIVAGPIVVRGDASRLQQVVWNLLSNAVKFTPAGGRVQLRLEPAGKCARLTVTDTGEGIEPKDLERIFGRFEQAEGGRSRRHGGLGIGLAVVRQLVELHGGTVEARSAGLGHGATFMVELPLMIAQASVASEAPPSDAGGAPLAGVRVLVVDDDADARALLQRVLKEAGAQVACASDASEGLAALPRIRPDVLLSDIGMSGMDGYAFVRRVRGLSPEEGRDIPAAAITAYAREEDRAEAMKAGFQAHLGKPVMSDEVVAVVRSLARRGPRYTIG